MRKVTALVLFIALYSWVISSQLQAQDFWQATSITGPSLAFANPAGFYLGVGPRIFRSTDNGTTWDSLFTTASRMNELVWGGGQTLLVPTEGAGLYRSTDGGMAWSLAAGLPAYVRHVAKGAGDNVYAGTRDSGVYLSTNSGLTWSSAWAGMTEENISGLTVTSNGTLLAAVKGANGIYQSTDNGAHWTATGMTTSYRVYSLFVAANGHVFAGTSETANGIYRSTDNGATWSAWALAGQAMGTFPGTSVGNTIFWPTGSMGVARFVNENGNLDTVNSGLTNRAVFGFAYWNGYLYVGTQAGLFRSRETFTDVNPSGEYFPRQFGISPNYPNPFNPATTIQYELPAIAQVRVIVYNVLGKEIATLASGYQTAGNKSVHWDGSNMPSGIYFYLLDATSVSDPKNHFSQTRKMLLVK